MPPTIVNAFYNPEENTISKFFDRAGNGDTNSLPFPEHLSPTLHDSHLSIPRHTVHEFSLIQMSDKYFHKWTISSATSNTVLLSSILWYLGNSIRYQEALKPKHEITKIFKALTHCFYHQQFSVVSFSLPSTPTTPWLPLIMEVLVWWLDMRWLMALTTQVGFKDDQNYCF